MNNKTFLQSTGYFYFLVILSICTCPRDLQSAWVPQTSCSCEYCIQNQAPGSSCDCADCKKQCPQCDGFQCVLETKEIPVEKSFYQTKQEIVCLPKVRFPWQQDRPPSCSKSRTVNRLEKRTFECRQCSYAWKVTEPVCESDACSCSDQPNSPPAVESPRGTKTPREDLPFKIVDPLPPAPTTMEIPRHADEIHDATSVNAAVAPIHRYEHSQTRPPHQNDQVRQSAAQPPAPVYPAMPRPQGVMATLTDNRPPENSFHAAGFNVPREQAPPALFHPSSTPLPRKLPSPKKVFQRLLEAGGSFSSPQKQ